MGLSEREQVIWDHSLAGLEGLPEVDHAHSVRIPVNDTARNITDIMTAVIDAKADGKITYEDVENAAEFVEAILLSGDNLGIVAELPYEEGDNGLELLLKFPQKESDYGH